MTDHQRLAGGGPSEFEGRKPDLWGAVMEFRDGERQLAPGETLVAQGEPFSGLFQVTEGWLAYGEAHQAGSRILQVGLPGTLVGNRDEKTINSVWALTAAAVSVVSAANLVALSLEYPGVGERLRSLAVRPRAFFFERMPNAASLSSRERVAQLLLELFIRTRAHWPDHTAEQMLLPLSAAHVAAASGAGNAGDVLRGLQNENILRLDGGGIAVINPDQLVDAAGIDLHTVRSFLLG